MATVESTCDPYQSSILSALAQARQVSLPSSSEEGVRSPTTTVLTSFHSPRTFHSEIVDAPYPTMQTDGTGTSQFQGGSDTWFSRDSAVTGLSHLEEDRVSESYYNDSDPGAVVGPPVDNANGSTSDAARGARTGLTSSIIAFNTKDALTNEPLVDPVLGSDGLIHDRWSLLDTDNALARSITMCVKGLTSCSITIVRAHELLCCIQPGRCHTASRRYTCCSGGFEERVLSETVCLSECKLCHYQTSLPSLTCIWANTESGRRLH